MWSYIIIYAKGLCMGAADVVPGVSGGTIAFITGIYERLLGAIAHIDTHMITLALQGRIKSAWKHIDGNFLIILGAGIASAFLLLARVVLYLMEHHTEVFWGGMAGLILASTFLVWRQLKKWQWYYILPLLVGLLLALFISIASPAETPDALWFIFISGMIAICAMILPGISGSFILVLLQKYEYMMLAIKELRITEIVVFMAGCLVGILSFARVLKYLFKHYHDLTVMLMAGFMLGSLVKLWPWKIMQTIHGGTKEVLVLPHAYSSHPHTGEVILTFLLCFCLVAFLEYLASKKST